MSKKNKNRWRIIIYGVGDEKDPIASIGACIRGYDAITLREFIEYALSLKENLVIYRVYCDNKVSISKNKIVSKLRRFQSDYNITLITSRDGNMLLPSKKIRITKKLNSQKLLGEIK